MGFSERSACGEHRNAPRHASSRSGGALRPFQAFATQIGKGIGHLPYIETRNPTRGPEGGWGSGAPTRPRRLLSDKARAQTHRFTQVQVRKLSIGVTASLTPALAGWVGALRRPSAKNACCFIPRGVSSHSDRALLTSDRSGLSGGARGFSLKSTGLVPQTYLSVFNPYLTKSPILPYLRIFA